MRARILCVDDDPDLLRASRRVLQNTFDLDTALGADEGLEAIAEDGPYAVVVSDQRMPGIDGIEFLSRVRELAPLTVRMMLTGDTDQRTAIDAVNQGHIFRFLSKPCPSKLLIEALEQGVRQYQLVTAEKEILEQTLSGSVKVLTDVLSLVSPVAFGRASRVQRLATELARLLKVENLWEVEVAATLSQVGCVSLPGDVLQDVYQNRKLKPEAQAMFDKHPATGAALLDNIPRLENVARMVALQEKRFDGVGPPEDVDGGDALPIGARILKLTLDVDTLVTSGMEATKALEQIRQRKGWYDPAVVEVLYQAIGSVSKGVARAITLAELVPGMVLVHDLVCDDLLLVARGNEVSVSMCERLRNFGKTRPIPEPIEVIAPKGF